MGIGRIEYLQTEIVKAIKRAQANNTLSTGGVEDIFGSLLKDVTIKSKLNTVSTDTKELKDNDIGACKKMWDKSEKRHDNI